MSQDRVQELEIKYMQLKDKVKKMLSAQKEFYKSKGDKQKLIIAKRIEKEVTELIDPEIKPQQSLFDWLAQ